MTAPLHGFSGAADYYDRSSSMQFIEAVRVPTLLFAARDDPFIPPAALARAVELASTNDSVTIETTERGGHVGWIEGTAWPMRYYMEQRIIDYMSL